MDTSDPNDKPTPYMSPKLREKLYDSPEGGGGGGRDDSHDQPPAWMGPAILGLLAVALVVVGMGVMRSNAEKKRLAVIAHADSLRAAAAAESVAAVMRDSLRADSLRAAAMPHPKPTPTPKPTAAAAKGSTSGGSAAGAAAASAPPPPTKHYGLIVGEFMDEAKANEVKDKLTGDTSLPGRVVSIENGNSFQVILGSFDSKADASKAAADLSSKGQVSEARVTVLK